MLHCLRGKTLPLATQLLSHSSPVCRPCFSSVAFRLYQSPPSSRSLPILHHSAWNLSTRLGLHTSSQLHKRKREVKENAFLKAAQYHWQEIKKIPKPASVLGFAGAVPFVAVPVAMCLMQHYIPNLATMQVFYGACILSFLGGVRWGYSLPDESPVKPNWSNFVAGAFFPSIACISLLFVNIEINTAAFGLGMGFATCMLVDIYNMHHLDLASMNPLWYKWLRVMLTVIVLFSLIATGVCSVFYPEPVIPTVNPVTPQKTPKEIQ